MHGSDEAKVQEYQNGSTEFYDSLFTQTLQAVRQKNLVFTHNLAESLEHADIVFLALPTPTKTEGENAGMAYDLSEIEDAVVKTVKFYNQNPSSMKDRVIIVEKSTVPIGTASMLNRIIQSNSNKELKGRYLIVSNPEFIAEGSPISELLKPDRVVIGCREQNADVSNLEALYHFAKDRIIKTNASSSELSKLVANCFLAQRISSINSISIFCEQYEADVKEVKTCIAADTRIGKKFLNSGVGFGGNSFKRDILALIYLAQCKQLHEVAKHWNSVLQMNQYRQKTFFQRVFNELNTNLKSKKLAIFGTAYKNKCPDARESPAI